MKKNLKKNDNLNYYVFPIIFQRYQYAILKGVHLFG
jgi:hypothetical protein